MYFDYFLNKSIFGFPSNNIWINYVSQEDVYYFTRKQPLEEKAKLDHALAR